MKILTVIIIALVVIYAVVIIYNIYYKQNKIEIVGRSSFICNKLKNIYFEYPIFKGPQKNTIICGDPKAQEQSEIEIIQRSDAGYSWLTTFITLENIASSSLPNLQKNKNNIPYLLNLEEKELRFVVSDNNTTQEKEEHGKFYSFKSIDMISN